MRSLKTGTLSCSFVHPLHLPQYWHIVGTQYSSPFLSMGDMFQGSLWTPDTRDSIKLYIYTMFFLYIL